MWEERSHVFKVRLINQNLKSASIFYILALFEIINMAYFTLPFPCQYVGACYGRSITPQPLSEKIEKKSKLDVPAGYPLAHDVVATLNQR